MYSPCNKAIMEKPGSSSHMRRSGSLKSLILEKLKAMPADAPPMGTDLTASSSSLLLKNQQHNAASFDQKVDHQSQTSTKGVGLKAGQQNAWKWANRDSCAGGEPAASRTEEEKTRVLERMRRFQKLKPVRCKCMTGIRQVK